MQSLLLLVLLSIFLTCHATNYTWALQSGGNWADATSWTPNGVPGPNDNAYFPNSAASCGGISTAGWTANCLVSLGQATVTVGGITSDDYSGFTIGSGTLITTGYNNFINMCFMGVTITTRGVTDYSPGNGDPGNMILYNVQWTNQGTAHLSGFNWLLYTSTFTNTGTVIIEYDASPHNGGDDYSGAKFVNSGLMNISSSDAQWGLSLTCTHTSVVNFVDGVFAFFGIDYPIAKQLTTSWSGTINVSPTMDFSFYTGQHIFNSDLVWNVPAVTFQAMQSQYFGMNVTFNIPITIPSMSLVDGPAVHFNYPTTLLNLDFQGGFLGGNSKSIVIKNMTGGCALLSPYCPTFTNNYTILVDAHIGSEFDVAPGCNLQISGSVYSFSLQFGGTDSGGGTVTVLPSATLFLYAFDDSLTHRHTAHIPIYFYGSLVTLPPDSGYSCVGAGSLLQWAGGGVLAGRITTLNCGNNDGGGDCDFAGGWTYEKGCVLTGEGSFSLSGSFLGDYPSPNHYFNIPMTVNYLFLSADPVLILNAPLAVNNFVWDGGIVYGRSATNCLTLSSLPTHVFSNSYNRVLTLDGALIYNKGEIDVSGGMSSVNGGTLINDGTLYVTSGSFGSAIIINNNNITSDYNGIWASQIKSYGIFYFNSDASNTVDWRMDGCNFTLYSTSIVSLNIFGANSYDVFDLFNVDYCDLGGKLIVHFVQPIPTPGVQVTAFSPMPGDKFPILTMPLVGASTVGGCYGSFSSIQIVGLDSKYTAGLQWDIKPDFVSEILVNLVICDASDTSCASIARANQPPPAPGAAAGPTSGAAGPTSGAAGPTSGAAGPTSGAAGPTSGAAGPTSGTPTSGTSSSTKSVSSRLSVQVVTFVLIIFVFVFAL